MFWMSRRAWILCGLAALACAGPLGAPDSFVAELTAPWTEMALPLDDGRVVFCTDAMVTVHHPRQSVEALTAAYARALEAAGYVKRLDTSSDDMTSVSFDNDSSTLALGVLSSKSETIASITRYPK